MATVVDQEWLINWLRATLDPDGDVRSVAEASLNQASLLPGFGFVLSKVAANRELSYGLRQLAAVLLKQFIKKHWQEGDESFEHPVVDIEEKEMIRKFLMASLDDSHRKICTAISMAIAAIAVYDWPEDWPDLMPFLLKLMNDQRNHSGVNGALKCLAMISGDLDDRVVPSLIPALFPCLFAIASASETYDKYLRAKALSIVYSCTYMLGAMRSVYKAETHALMSPMLKSWMNLFSTILIEPVHPEEPDDWSMRMEVLKCLNQLVQNFPRLTESEFVVVLGPLWQTFMTSFRVYVLASVDGVEDSYEGSYDSEGEDKSFDSFVIQLFEFLLTIVASSRLKEVVRTSIKELAYYTIGFLQITKQQNHTWSMDANQFVVDEEDVTYTCRNSGVLLLEEVVESFGDEAIIAIVYSVKARFCESQQEKSTSSNTWWRMQEAALFALASLSDHLLEVEDSEFTGIKLGTLVEEMVTKDLGTSLHDHPFLYARLFVSVAKFSSLISHGVLEHYLKAAVKAVGMDVPPPVKIGACRALSQLLPGANKEVIQSEILGLFASLSDLIYQVSDETLHLVLGTLQVVITAGHKAGVSVEQVIAPVILNLWTMHVSDPFVILDIIDALEALKKIPGAVHPLVSRILPQIGPVLSNPHTQPSGLVAASLDLVTMLLKNAPIDVIKAVNDVCFDAIIRILLQSDDHSELQNATLCLAALVAGGKQLLLTWAADPECNMRSMLDVVSRLLSPEMESSGSLFVGSYILQLILHLPHQMANHIQHLVVALIRRLQSAQITGLRSSLLLIFARLVHMSVPNVEQFVDFLVSTPAESYVNAFVYLMSEWTMHQAEVQGAYQIKVTTSALVLLLSARHPEIGKVCVHGHLIKSSAEITTRSKAKTVPDQWTVIPLPAKIVALLADALVEIEEQASLPDEDEIDCEEIEEGGVEPDNRNSFFCSAGTSSHGRTTYGQLEAFAKAFDENDGDEDEDEDEEDEVLQCAADPLNEINLESYIADFFVNFSRKDRPLLDHLCQGLSSVQRKAIQRILKSGHF